MTRGDLLGLLAAFSLTVGMFAALWFFLSNYWAALPPWVAVPICVLVAVAAIGSPIYALARISNRMVERQRTAREASGKLP